MEASVAIAMALDSIFVRVDACGHVGRSQQQLLELGEKIKPLYKMWTKYLMQKKIGIFSHSCCQTSHMRNINNLRKITFLSISVG